MLYLNTILLSFTLIEASRTKAPETETFFKADKLVLLRPVKPEKDGDGNIKKMDIIKNIKPEMKLAELSLDATNLVVTAPEKSIKIEVFNINNEEKEEWIGALSNFDISQKIKLPNTEWIKVKGAIFLSDEYWTHYLHLGKKGKETHFKVKELYFKPSDSVQRNDGLSKRMEIKSKSGTDGTTYGVITINEGDKLEIENYSGYIIVAKVLRMNKKKQLEWQNVMSLQKEKKLSQDNGIEVSVKNTNGETIENGFISLAHLKKQKKKKK